MTAARTIKPEPEPETRVDPGPVVWITGLSGAGKSTTARSLANALRAEGQKVLVLDGDEFRAAVGDGLGHSPEDRLVSAQRLVRFASLSSRQGVTTVVATMSLYTEIHQQVRAAFDRLRVVYLDTPRQCLEARDPKGLYAAARVNNRLDVVGVHLPFDPPLRPDLTLESASEHDLTNNVALIRSSLVEWLPITKG